MSGVVDLEPLVVSLIAKDAVRVPPYPAAAMRLQKVVATGNFGIPDLVKVIGEDQVLAATLLRCANSPMYRGVDAINSLQGAVSRIGAAEVCRIAMAITVGAAASSGGVLAELRRQAWRQSLVSAHVCRELGVHRGLSGDESFVCGLLHDFGRVVAVACFEEILTRNHDTRVLSAAEWSISVDRFHVELGLVTAARWNLSALVCAVISAHHEPSRGGSYRAMLDVVIVADVLGELLEKKAGVTSADLAQMPLNGPEEANFLLKVLPQIPGFVAALDDAAPVSEPAAAPRSQVAPDTVLTGTVKRVDFPIKVLKTQGEISFQATHVALNGLGFVGSVKLKPNNMIRLRLEHPTGAFDVWSNVLHCTAEGEQQRCEVKLFALDGNAQSRWDRIFTAG